MRAVTRQTKGYIKRISFWFKIIGGVFFCGGIIGGVILLYQKKFLFGALAIAAGIWLGYNYFRLMKMFDEGE